MRKIASVLILISITLFTVNASQSSQDLANLIYSGGICQKMILIAQMIQVSSTLSVEQTVTEILIVFINLLLEIIFRIIAAIQQMIPLWIFIKKYLPVMKVIYLPILF
ncbi:transmembrane protein, putative (macronuclear) [Tetrahymena thermophila SB210]|uniref:Transmembrane protein, putative n=1 Tax=Tetrahymena thermophila (strain SB210) TaxID=312017 RepID=W7XIM4_TETTS|nr:transmembrane protein, putative [Tetrahymena thermophila SB210]EWS74761.1 transmembrane protein, putative [Tetrahymena thermophila SB210]|eukprot:XP_012652762.1 transmembrane protein, putative [Tetrahymena thermophila SB210]